MTRAAAWIAMVTLLGLPACGGARAPDATIALVDTAPPATAEASLAVPPEGPSDEPDEPTAKGFSKKRPAPEQPAEEEHPSPKIEDLQKAREIFKRGVAAYTSQDYQAAKTLFEQAYALVPENTILFNIASAELRMGQTQMACAHFKTYLANGDPTSARIQEVQQQVQGRCP